MVEKFIKALNLSKKVFNNENIFNYKNSDLIILVSNNLKISIEFGINNIKIYFGENSNFEFLNYHILIKKFKKIDEIELIRKKFFSKFTYLELLNSYVVTLSDESIKNYNHLNYKINNNDYFQELIISKEGKSSEIVTINNFDEQYLQYIMMLNNFLNKNIHLNERKDYEIIYYDVENDIMAVKDVTDIKFNPYSEYNDIRMKTKKKIVERNISIEMRYLNNLFENKYPLVLIAYDDTRKKLKHPQIIIENKIKSILIYLEKLFFKNLYKTITIYSYELYILIKSYLLGYDIEVIFSSEQSLFDFIFDDFECIINKNGI